MEYGEQHIRDGTGAKTLSDMKINLRTEITPAMGFCDLLISENYGKLSGTQMDRIQRINKHLAKMTDIISPKQ